MSGRHSTFARRLAVELAELVLSAEHDVYADEVREWLVKVGRCSPQQATAAGFIAEEQGWIERHGREATRLIWGTPIPKEAA